MGFIGFNRPALPSEATSHGAGSQPAVLRGNAGASSSPTKKLTGEQRQELIEKKRRTHEEEIAQIDEKIWMAEFRGDEFEWCTQMGLRSLAEENYTDRMRMMIRMMMLKRTKRSQRLLKRMKMRTRISTRATVATAPSRKLALKMWEKERERKRQRRMKKEHEKQRINRDMARAYVDGDDLNYHTQIGLRMLVDESESEEEDEDDYNDRSDMVYGSSGFVVETQPTFFNHRANAQPNATTNSTMMTAQAARKSIT